MKSFSESSRKILFNSKELPHVSVEVMNNTRLKAKPYIVST